VCCFFGRGTLPHLLVLCCPCTELEAWVHRRGAAAGAAAAGGGVREECSPDGRDRRELRRPGLARWDGWDGREQRFPGPVRWLVGNDFFKIVVSRIFFFFVFNIIPNVHLRDDGGALSFVHEPVEGGPRVGGSGSGCGARVVGHIVVEFFLFLVLTLGGGWWYGELG